MWIPVLVAAALSAVIPLRLVTIVCEALARDLVMRLARE